ncbi:MAG TPA: monovalent cation/H(+) antiporter subunit G [Ornithinicoccus sp.]|nr:monovalent cation/H(+) antiporter subunit G [Ornithinicoccus sp.]
MTHMIVQVVVGVLAIGGGATVLVSSLAMLRAPDAVSRVNVLSPATGLGMPCLVLAVWLEWTYENGLDGTVAAKALVAVLAFIVVSSVASNTLGRAALRSGAALDPRTAPNDLTGNAD